MRIISGFLKGRKIEGFHLEGTRPTMDRVKESLFAMIQEKLANSTCLDLFSGSGNLGLEAISQNASLVYFNDCSLKAIQIIKKNISNFEVQKKSVVLHFSYQKAIQYLENIKFDIIFLDPPYHTDYIEKSIFLIEKYQLLNQEGMIVCESDDLDKIKYSNAFYSVKEKKYGDKWVVLLKKI